MTLQNGRLYWIDEAGDLNGVNVNGSKRQKSIRDHLGRKFKAVIGLDVDQHQASLVLWRSLVTLLYTDVFDHHLLRNTRPIRPTMQP